MSDTQSDISFKSFFLPLTTTKALHILLITGFIVFGNTLLNGFVWDDLSNILFNPQVQSFNLLSGFEKSNVNQGLQFRPVVTFYFSLLYKFFADMPFFYHVFNVLFHITNSILVYFLLKHFFKLSPALYLSLIFLVHPMQVESAAWISTAGNLYFFFGMLALLISIRGVLTVKKSIGISVLLMLSLFSKETGIVFPIMMLVYMIFWKREDLWKAVGISSIIIVLYGFLRLIVTQVQFEAPLKIIPIARLPLSERLINVPEIIWYYFKTFFYPRDLVIMQYWTVQEINFRQFYLPILLLGLFVLLMTLVGVYVYRHRKKVWYTYLYFILWLLLGLLLHIHISPLNMTVADRWFYFPMVGMLALVGIYGNLIWEKWGSKKIAPYLTVIGCTTIIVLSLRTIIRNADWRDDLALYLHDRQIQTNFNIENNIGWNYQQQNNWKTANTYYKRSVELYPYYAISLNNLAYSYVVLKDQQKARYYFYKVLDAADYYPDAYAKALNFAAWALTQTDTPEAANNFTKRALQKSPTNAALWAYIAVSEYKLGNNESAKKAIQKAISLSSNKQMQALHALIEDDKPLPKNIPLF